MRILLNFVPLKSGGGVQVALDFVAQAKRLGGHHHWYLVATRGTPLACIEETPNFHLVRVISRSLLARLWFELIGCRAVLKRAQATVVYTQFGPHWPGARRVRNVVGCAYSNLFYPDVKFWERMSLPQRLRRELIDIFRRRRLYSADLVVFETVDLAERAVRLLKLPRQRVAVVRPTVSTLVSPASRHDDTRRRCESIPPGYRVLLLSAYNPNKNIDLLPEVAAELDKAHGATDVIFVITLPFQLAETRSILEKAQRLGVAAQVYNLGPVPHEGCAEVYRVCNAVILPSQLESFSNTIAEAWNMSKPLLISDKDWARSLCADAAIYFRYGSVREIAKAIVALKGDPDAGDRLVRNGTQRLSDFPTSEERFLSYVSLIEQDVVRPWPRDERASGGSGALEAKP